jgi:hypothetical protein
MLEFVAVFIVIGLTIYISLGSGYLLLKLISKIIEK